MNITTTDTTTHPRSVDELVKLDDCRIMPMVYDWTPGQVDSVLSECYARRLRAATRLAGDWTTVHLLSGSTEGRGRMARRTLEDGQAAAALRERLAEYSVRSELVSRGERGWEGYRGLMSWDARQAESALAGIDARGREIAELRHLEGRLGAEYRRRPWSRFFLVTSSAGHVHRSMDCHSCTWRTTYAWLPDLAGSTDAAAVDAIGPALCTHCFPDAPVEWTSRRLTKGGKLSKAAR